MVEVFASSKPRRLLSPCFRTELLLLCRWKGCHQILWGGLLQMLYVAGRTCNRNLNKRMTDTVVREDTHAGGIHPWNKGWNDCKVASFASSVGWTR